MTAPSKDIPQSLMKTTIIDGRQEVTSTNTNTRITPEFAEDERVIIDIELDVDSEHERQRSEQPQETLDEFLKNTFGDAGWNGEGIPPPYWLKEKFKTKSAVIRYLYQERGLSVKEISKHTGFLYQQCRNVLTNELKRGPNESFKLGADDQVVKSLVPLLPKKPSKP